MESINKMVYVALTSLMFALAISVFIASSRGLNKNLSFVKEAVEKSHVLYQD